MKSIQLKPKTKALILFSMISVFLLAGFNNCSQAGKIAIKDNTAASSSRAPASVVNPVYIDKVKDFNVVNSVQNKVDILIVIDNSGSMSYEQSNMAARFSSFIDELRGLDWQIGLVTTDVDNDVYLKDGQMIHADTDASLYILNSTMDVNLVKSAFAEMIQRPETGSSNEQGIKATYRMLERAMDSANLSVNAPNRQLLRADAAFAVVVVTDADETFSSKAKDIYKNDPNNLYNFVHASFPNKNFSYNSIIVRTGDDVCLNNKTNSNEGYGVAYETISSLTGGLVGTVCADDYGLQLANIGQSISQLTKSLQLDCIPVDSDGDGHLDISVQYSYLDLNNVMQKLLYKDYVVNTNKVNALTSFASGQYHVQYRCQQ